MEKKPSNLLLTNYLIVTIIVSTLNLLYEFRWIMDNVAAYIAIFPILNILTSLAAFLYVMISVYVLRRFVREKRDKLFLVMPILVIADATIRLLIVGPAYFMDLNDKARLGVGGVASALGVVVSIFLLTAAIYLYWREYHVK